MKWIETYGLWILIVVATIVFTVAFFVPICVGIAREMWQWALYGEI